MTPHILDQAVWTSLTGAHARFSQGGARAKRYDPEVSPFTALSDFTDPAAWEELDALIGPGAVAVLAGPGLQAPSDWEKLEGGTGHQMLGEGLYGERDAQAVSLGADDVVEMMDLVQRAKPGPFARRTVELGGYFGIRIDGKLAAMAGCRLNPPGWREISAVCTDEEYRGRGLGRRLVNTVVAEIRSCGEVPFLHVSTSNENAIRLYEDMGFRIRVTSNFGGFRKKELD